MIAFENYGLSGYAWITVYDHLSLKGIILKYKYMYNKSAQKGPKSARYGKQRLFDKNFWQNEIDENRWFNKIVLFIMYTQIVKEYLLLYRVLILYRLNVFN